MATGFVIILAPIAYTLHFSALEGIIQGAGITLIGIAIALSTR